MRLHVALTPAELKSLDLPQWRAVVIDVTRATSTISQAIASGAERIIPVASIAEARRVQRSLGEGALLGGERGGLRIPGFHLGNSPRDYTAKAVKGKTIVFTTTNGTRALKAAAKARETLIGAFLNQGAAVRRLARGKGDIVLVCAGREGEPVPDDTACAGAFVERLLEAIGDAAPTEEAAHALAHSERYRGRIAAALRESPSGKALIAVGLGRDLADCAKLDALKVVPALVRGEVVRLR